MRTNDDTRVHDAIGKQTTANRSAAHLDFFFYFLNVENTISNYCPNWF